MKLNIDEKRIPEILLAIILVVVLLILILLVTNQPTGKSVSAISNSQNTNSFNTYNVYEEKYFPTRNSGYVKIYDSQDDYSEGEYLNYKSRSEIERVKGLFGNDIDRYKVYVKNTEYKGGYFKVNFYFEDYYGDRRVETLTKYIPAREEEVFYYTDIYADRLKNYNWDYKVTPHTKI